ncbi:glycosyltransferase family 1 protein [Corynebacterium lizhenjunii]|uniref:Glycosyltransferase family 1 protein n=1 Tax=Corynebacterium lizhenjunii TaxID=2709394 RepID=A0A7T0KER5_9CORY|nr:glycosyltransferase family 1 protein [Corynebacterium lizhenjunii]QPK79445.1 glycosyltransferase family 1 protein [Corynebacterium lizhenjunii]
MRVAIVAESFLPNVNGVSNSVLRVLEHLHATGHQAMVVAPGARAGQEEIADYLGFPIYRVPTVRVPLVNSLPVGVPTRVLASSIADFCPDVVHLASPFVLGAAGAQVARRRGIPAVAVYQTDVAGFATQYHLPWLAAPAWGWLRAVHNSCRLTLAPSSATIAELQRHRIGNVAHWGRGVDAQRFHPRHRSHQLRARWDPSGTKRIVGFVGRLAAEKGLHRLAGLLGRDDLQVVIIGEGPLLGELQSLLPNAHFTGALGGHALAQAYASLDVFVHPGEFETFCQSIQEAQACGVPAIAPRAGGPIDLITPGYNGQLLDVENFARDLPAAVSGVLAPRVHSHMCANARASIADKTWQAVCEQLLGYYRQVLV